MARTITSRIKEFAIISDSFRGEDSSTNTFNEQGLDRYLVEQNVIVSEKQLGLLTANLVDKGYLDVYKKGFTQYAGVRIHFPGPVYTLAGKKPYCRIMRMNRR